MVTKQNPNIRILQLAVQRLEPLLDEIAVLGGCATGLLITDPAAAPVRGTTDIDVIIEITSYAAYTRMETRLRALGFRECPDENVICRWCIDGLMVDVMPTDTAILGFGNRWYLPALKNSQWTDIGAARVRSITAPYFLATKLEAFYGRGHNDFLGSRDIQDIIAVVDGRSELVAEVHATETDLREYLQSEFAQLLRNESFMDAISGHLMPDEINQDRRSLIVDRLKRLAK